MQKQWNLFWSEGTLLLWLSIRLDCSSIVPQKQLSIFDSVGALSAFVPTRRTNITTTFLLSFAGHMLVSKVCSHFSRLMLLILPIFQVGKRVIDNQTRSRCICSLRMLFAAWDTTAFFENILVSCIMLSTGWLSLLVHHIITLSILTFV